MKRYDEDIIYPENREEYYAGMVEEPKGNWVKYEEASELLTEFAKAIVELNDTGCCIDNITTIDKAEQYLKGVYSE